MDLDYDGNNNIRVDYTTVNGSQSVRFTNTTCPAGRVYVSFGLQALANDSGAGVEIRATDAGSAIYLSKRLTLAGSYTNEVAFAFHNPSSQPVVISLFLTSKVSNQSLIIKEPLIKHEDGSIQSFSLKDTVSGKRFTNRFNQMHSWVGRIPHVEIGDWADLATGNWFVGPLKQTTINNAGGYAAGTTTIVVADGTKISVGDYMYFKPAPTSGYSAFHQGTATTGNKVSNVTGNVVELVTGIPISVADGSSVIACKVFQCAANTQL